jgi:hypothetical protein
VDAPAFAALLEATGLTVDWLARQYGVSQSLVRSWTTHPGTPPPEPARLLTAFNDWQQEQVDAAAGIAAKGSAVYLLSYRCAEDYDFGTTTAEAIPYPVHQRLIARIYGQLTAHGHRVHVTVFDPLAYELWLAGRKDTHEHRQAWLTQE